MKKFYPIQVNDLNFQGDPVYLKEIQLVNEYKSEPHNTHRNDKLFAILIKHREIKLISDGKENTRVKFKKVTFLSMKNFIKKYNLKDDTLTESDLQKICNYFIYPRG